MRLIHIYRCFYREVESSALLISSGVSQIEKVLNGKPIEVIFDPQDLATDWRAKVFHNGSNQKTTQEAKFMLDVAAKFIELNELQKQKLQQLEIESKKFYPLLKSFCS